MQNRVLFSVFTPIFIDLLFSNIIIQNGFSILTLFLAVSGCFVKILVQSVTLDFVVQLIYVEPHAKE